MKQWRLRNKIYLPEFTVKIEVVSMTDLDQAEYVYGEDGGVIRLGKGMSVNQQKYYFSHELQHAATDYHHKLVVGGARP